MSFSLKLESFKIIEMQEASELLDLNLKFVCNLRLDVYDKLFIKKLETFKLKAEILKTFAICRKVQVLMKLQLDL